MLVLGTMLVGMALGPFASRAAAAQTPGVQAHVLWANVDDAEMDRQLGAAKAAGARLVRVDVGWTTFEEDGKGRYADWYLRRIDRLVEKAEAHGIELLLTVLYSPCWASSAPQSLKQDCSPGWWDRGVASYAPRDPADYADAMAFLASRYRGRVKAWELWNEPNLDDFYNAPDAAQSYARLVKTSYPAIKRADPSATVVAGALADAAHTFTDELYRAGIKGYFDAFSVHPYSGNSSPLDPQEDPYVHASFVRGVPAVRNVMVSHGDSRPLWLTEFGYNTSDLRNANPWQNGVDEATQATYLKQAFRQMQAWDYVQVGVWYNVKDRGTDKQDSHQNYGLLRYDNSAKPAYAAYREAANGLVGGAGPGSSGRSARMPRISFRILKRGRKLFVRGSGPRRAVVRLRGYRYDTRRRDFRHNPAFRMRIKTSSSPRFLRRLPAKRLRHGRWRFVADAAPRALSATRAVVLR